MAKKKSTVRFTNAKPNGTGKSLSITGNTTPAATSYRVQPLQPSIMVRNGVSHVEGSDQIATVSNSVSFAATKYNFNPGLSLYPWLSTQAAGWEKHHEDYIDVVYVPDVAVTTTAGSIFLVADFDPNDSAPTSLSQMSTYEYRVDGRVYDCLRLRIPASRMYDGVKAKKIRNGPVAGDLQLYDACSFSVCTVSGANTNAIGQLWVYYTTTLISRQTESTSIIPPNLVILTMTSAQTFATTVAEDIDFNVSISSGFTVTNTSNGTYTLPPGAYEFYGDLAWQDTSAESFQAVVTFLVNGSTTSPAQLSSTNMTSIANGIMTESFCFYAASTSEFTVRFSATLTGAAGTLTAVANQNRLTIRAVG